MAGKGGLAEKIRTGLETDSGSTAAVMADKPGYLDELYYWKPVRQHIREFGCALGAMALVVAAFAAWKGQMGSCFAWSGAGAALAVFGAFLPGVLYPLWKAFNMLGQWLGAFSTLLIVTVCWLLMMIPMAVLMRVVKKRVMDLTYAVPVQTYWEARDTKFDDFRLMEKQY